MLPGLLLRPVGAGLGQLALPLLGQRLRDRATDLLRRNGPGGGQRPPGQVAAQRRQLRAQGARGVQGQGAQDDGGACGHQQNDGYGAHGLAPSGLGP